jgi:ribonuclease HI
LARSDPAARIAALERRLAEELERERVLDLEVQSLRRDLDVKAAYVKAMEEGADERQRQTAWLQEHFDIERKRADALAAELAAERARVSYRIMQLVVRLSRRGR